MTAGTDQSAQEVKYLMVGCYTVPISRDGRSFLPVPGQEQTEQDQPLPGLDEEVEGMEVEGDEQVLPEEDEPIDEGDTRHVRSAQSMHSTWHRLVEEAQNVAVHQITFVEPVKSRAVKHVQHWLACTAGCEAWAFPSSASTATVPRSFARSLCVLGRLSGTSSQL